MSTNWVAFSGGCDSHVLLHISLANRVKCKAVHINDHLSSNADVMQKHCEDICKQLGVELKVVDLKLDLKKGQSIEEVSRNARYEYWQRTLGADDVLMLGHHANDQAETILYRLMRGSSPHGMSGMKVYSKMSSLRLYRPLLHATKEEILAYAEIYKLNFIQDDMNLDLRFDRNFLRHKIIPELQKRWPASVENIANFADLNQKFVRLVQPIILDNLEKVVLSGSLVIEKLNSLNLDIRTEVLRAWLIGHDIIPSSSKLHIIKREIIDAKPDAMPSLKISNKEIKRANGMLYVVPIDNNAQLASVELDWNINEEIELPNGRILTPNDAPKIEGDMVTVKLGSHGEKAKKIFQSHNIPYWERIKYPIIYSKDKLLSIVGLWEK